MKKLIRGFTLIELMIVISIMGILAAIALPTYQDYIARAQALDAVKSTEGLKTDIASYYWQTGSFPDSGNAVMDAAAALKGKYYSANGVKIEAGRGSITTSFDEGANCGKNVVFIPTTNSVNRQIITWRCEGSVGKNRIPSTCQ